MLWRMQPQDYEREVTLRSAVPTRLSGARMRRAGARWSCCPLTAPHRHGNVPAASRICHPTRIGDVSCGAGGFEVALNLLDLMDKRIVELQRRLDASGGERDSTLTLVLSTLNALRDRKRSISPPTFRELVAPPSSGGANNRRPAAYSSRAAAGTSKLHDLRIGHRCLRATPDPRKPIRRSGWANPSLRSPTR